MDRDNQKLSANYGRQTETEQMRVCPTCSLTLAADMAVCPNDGTVLKGSAMKPKLISNLAGQYEFIGKIGEGGMGVIYKARHLALNHLVAIKMMHVNQLDETKILRFQQEAKAVSSLDHPSIVRVRDFGISEAGQPHMVLDFIDGVTLDAMIKTHGPLSISDAKDLFSQICDAVAHAHQRKVLHRDLKPSNIMLVYRENQPPLPIIVDFGIAKVVDPGQQNGMNLTQTGEIFGSPFYMSPEQTAGKELDQRSDIYSVGCVLFEALTGAPPFVGQNAIETLIMHTSSLPPTLKQGSLGKVFPEALQVVVDKALAKDPNSRFQDMTSFKIALIQAIEQTGKAQSLKTSMEKKGGVNKTAILITATSLCLVGGLMATAWFLVNRTKPAASNSESQTLAAKTAAVGTSGGETSTVKKQGAQTSRSQTSADQTDDTRGPGKPTDESISEESVSQEIFDVDKRTAEGILKQKDQESIDILYITDKGMSAFDQVTRATSVALRHCSIEGSGLKHLEHLRLKTLIIEEDVLLRANAISYLSNQNDLHELSLEEDPITDESLVLLNDLVRLQSINLAKTAVTGNGLLRMRECHALQKIDLRKCLRLEDRDLALFADFTKLTELKLGGTNLKKINLLSRGPTIDHIEFLDMENTPFDDAAILECKPLPKLTAISLSHTAVTPKGLARLAVIAPALRKLDISDCKSLKYADLSCLFQFKDLKDVCLDGWKASDAGIENLVRLNLKKLSLERTLLSGEQLIKLAEMTNLKDLTIKNNASSCPEGAISQFSRMRPKVLR